MAQNVSGMNNITGNELFIDDVLMDIFISSSKPEKEYNCMDQLFYNITVHSGFC